MHSVRVPVRTGYCLLLDQCIACGGIWLDRWELHPIDAEVARELDDADHDLLWASLVPLSHALRCPRCNKELRRFTDPSWPADVDVERCRRCEGLWLNRGELRRVKSKSRKSGARRLDEVARESEHWPTIHHLDDATRHAVQPSEEPELGPQLLTGGAWIAARLLMRWFLGV